MKRGMRFVRTHAAIAVIVALAIVVSVLSPLSVGSSAADPGQGTPGQGQDRHLVVLAEDQFCEDENRDGFDIPVFPEVAQGSPIEISCAPSGAIVTGVAVRAEFDHDCTRQLNIRLDTAGPPIESIFLQPCKNEEGGEQLLEFRTEYFNGDPVNDTWTLYLRDCHDECDGHFNWWEITVYYVTPTATPSSTATATPKTPTATPSSTAAATTATPTATSGTPTSTPQTPIPELTPTATATSPPGLDLQIEHVELTQAIQCKDNSHCADNAVPLISGKETYARVYVKVTGSTKAVGNVSGEVTAKMPWGDYTTDPINASITAKLSPQRAKFNDTLNFHLPASLVDSSGTLQVRINDDRLVAETNYANNTKSVNMNFVTTPPLIIVPIWLDYDDGTTQGIVDGSMHYNLSYYLKNILPVGRIIFHILPNPTLKWNTQIGPGFGAWNSILAKLADMKKKDASASSAAHWYAMIPFKVPQGYVSGMAYMNGKAATGRVPVHHENLEDGADIMAHELGHNFNRQHSPCGTTPADPNYPYANAKLGDYGWDPQVAAGGKAMSWPDGWVVPAGSFDVMSYCQDEWISEYTYRAILNYRGSSPAAAEVEPIDYEAAHREAAQPAAARPVSEEVRPYLFASGSLTGPEVELDPWIILERPAGTDDDSGEGPYRLLLVGPQDQTLFERGFDTQVLQESWLPGAPPTGLEQETVTFYEVMPWEPETRRVQLWHYGELIAERGVSESAPVVGVISPPAGDFWPAGHDPLIEWHAEDGDGGPLWFDVAFSRDDGETWDVIATRLEQDRLQVQGDLFPGTEAALIQVFASDGILTSSAIGGPFEIARKPPQVSIVAPRDGDVAALGAPVRLRGYAYDAEDGMIADEAMDWESDRDGWIGSSPDMVVDWLSAGTHTLTLFAVDGDQWSGSDTVTVHVGFNVFLPMVAKG